MTPHVRLPVGCFGWSVGQNFLKGREVTPAIGALVLHFFSFSLIYKDSKYIFPNQMQEEQAGLSNMKFFKCLNNNDTNGTELF